MMTREDIQALIDEIILQEKIAYEKNLFDVPKSTRKESFMFIRRLKARIRRWLGIEALVNNVERRCLPFLDASDFSHCASCGHLDFIKNLVPQHSGEWALRDLHPRCIPKELKRYGRRSSDHKGKSKTRRKCQRK